MTGASPRPPPKVGNGDHAVARTGWIGRKVMEAMRQVGERQATQSAALTALWHGRNDELGRFADLGVLSPRVGGFLVGRVDGCELKQWWV